MGPLLFCSGSMKKNLALEAVVAPAVSGLGYEFEGLEYLSYGKNSTLRIYIDSPKGISLEDCQIVSRQVGSVLDVETDLVRGAYNLEVSSPGLDRKLFTLEQFQRVIGRQVRVVLQAPLISGKKSFVGKLTAVESEQVGLEVDGSVINLDFAKVAQANVVDEKAR